jgi:hypothetical protein
MYALQCRKKTDIIYHQIFSLRDSAWKMIDQTILDMKKQQNNKVSNSDDEYKYNMFLCFVEEVVARYHNYFEEGLSEEESIQLVKSIIDSCRRGSITYDLTFDEEEYY